MVRLTKSKGGKGMLKLQACAQRLLVRLKCRTSFISEVLVFNRTVLLLHFGLRGHELKSDHFR